MPVTGPAKQIALSAFILIGCSDLSTAPDAGTCPNPEDCAGAPAILQVFAREYTGPNSEAPWRIAFGTHPSTDPEDDGTVAEALTAAAEIHLIFDQPLDPTTIVEDGALKTGSVRILCEDADIPINFAASEYRPAINQTAEPGELPYSLGPAIVIRAATSLRTSSLCHFQFPGVRDQEGLRINNVDEPYFQTESLRLVDTAPAPGSIDVPLGQRIAVEFNAEVSPDQPDLLELLSGNNAVGQGIENVAGNPFALSVLPPPAGLSAATTYRVVARQGFLDAFGGFLQADVDFQFITSPMTDQ